MTEMMKCGHAANAVSDGKPCCATCVGIDSGYNQIAEKPNLEGRKAKCTYCGKITDSSTELPFFEYRGPGSVVAERQCKVCGYFTKDKPLIDGKYCYNGKTEPIPGVCINKGKQCEYGPREYDAYYCGCRGWD